MSLKVLILAWGSGTRLWPFSRKYYPKQFLKLKEFGGVSFFEKAISRALEVTDLENIFVITNQDYKFHCLNQSGLPEKNIIIETMQKNTLGAIALWVEQGTDEDIFLVLSSDHIMKWEDIFANQVQNSLKKATESIVLFGLKPSSPHTGYGYISFDTNTPLPHKVKEFKEKPNLATAETYIENGYYWNAGIFLFGKKIFLEELKKANSTYFALIQDWVSKNFEKLPDLSIDYGLLEHTDNIYLAPLDIYWNDLWGFESFDEYFSDHNLKEEIIEIDAKNNTSLSQINGKEVAFIWVDDLIVVDTKDALLVAKKWQSSKVKQVLEKLKNDGKTQSDFGMTVYRPWGSYTIIDEWVWFKSKRLSVLPGKKLSSQMHHHRSEHWVVVSGTAKVTLNDKEFLLQKWESTYIPIGTKHRLENPGKLELHLIESQIGDYLEEDDIVRFDDDFGRI